jgi:hypothetical protein
MKSFPFDKIGDEKIESYYSSWKLKDIEIFCIAMKK